MSDGNVVIVGESRQRPDLVDRFGGAASGNHATYRVLKRDGTEVKALTLASENAVVTEMWHGAAVINGGFAIRFAKAGRATIRIFNNDGTPRTGDIDLGNLAGSDLYARGGRGDGAGFDGNGKDAFAAVCTAQVTVGEVQINKPFVMVINADGTLRWARSAADDFENANSDRVDCAISEDGRVAVVFADSAYSAPAPSRLVAGRLFNRNGDPITGTFRVSEKETPDLATKESRHPRVAWRNNSIAVAWESGNAPDANVRVVAARFFDLPMSSVESAGLIAASPTTYINPPVENSPHPLNNGRVESLGVSIASNGNVIIGWEDDGSGL
ncbi:MAG: hypothetical protein FJ405_14265, partial [Verrucomicrobia bacterium]|nr:hypothetical protein [Verrucomicrobiota bacterium]